MIMRNMSKKGGDWGLSLAAVASWWLGGGQHAYDTDKWGNGSRLVVLGFGICADAGVRSEWSMCLANSWGAFRANTACRRILS